MAVSRYILEEAVGNLRISRNYHHIYILNYKLITFHVSHSVQVSIVLILSYLILHNVISSMS